MLEQRKNIVIRSWFSLLILLTANNNNASAFVVVTSKQQMQISSLRGGGGGNNYCSSRMVSSSSLFSERGGGSDDETTTTTTTDVTNTILDIPKTTMSQPADIYNEQRVVTDEESSSSSSSTWGSAALVSGTTIGAGILALPTATAYTGFIPSSLGLTIAWVFMTLSGLFIAELCLGTGKAGSGLLDLYKSVLGPNWGIVGSAAYFFLHYAIMVAYFAQGGSNLEQAFAAAGGSVSVSGGSLVFAGILGIILYTASSATVEKLNNILVVGVFSSFAGILALGVGSADFGSLVQPTNQHVNAVWNTFPILFLALVYQNVVPTIVTQLKGNRSNITTAIVAGTTLPFVMFLAWNGVILGNVLGTMDVSSGSTTNMPDPISVLKSNAGNGGDGGELLSTLVSSFSELAIITSVIGFVYGLLDAYTDLLDIPSVESSEKFEKYKPLLFAAIFIPPLLLANGNPSIFYTALDYGGAFGVSTLFLVLPPIMVWKTRYNNSNNTAKIMTTAADITTTTTNNNNSIIQQQQEEEEPMVPFGKIPIISMLVIATALITQQFYEKVIL